MIDYVFRYALEDSDVPKTRAWLLWAGVLIGRYFGPGRSAPLLTPLHVARRDRNLVGSSLAAFTLIVPMLLVWLFDLVSQVR